MKIRRKTDNNLVLVICDNEKKYYTSYNRAALAIGGVQAGSVKYACEKGKIIETPYNKVITVKLVDGSEIPYKLINND